MAGEEKEQYCVPNMMSIYLGSCSLFAVIISSKFILHAGIKIHYEDEDLLCGIFSYLQE